MIRFSYKTTTKLVSSLSKYNKLYYIPNNNISYILNKTSFKTFCKQSQLSKIKNILGSVNIEVKNQKKSLIDSGILKEYFFDSQANKVILSVNTVKDFPKIRNVLKKLFLSKGYQNIQVNLSQNSDRKLFSRKGNLQKVKKIIAVASCKGGVGKSTIAVNIAYQLNQQGFKIGLLDADVYGPSLPTLVNKQGQLLQMQTQNPNKLIPKQVNGVKCMSFGFLANQPVAMRGPMASSIVSQLLLQTQWNQLDYLIVDMPPGTGDVNLSLCQQIKFDGAIIVTTPQRLSFIDVLKGIQMFQDLRVRILSIVQNMSYYTCSKCGTIDQIFGKGHNKTIMDTLGIQNAFKIPLISQISACSDVGTPIVLALPSDHMVKQMYTLICGSICKQLQKPTIKGGVYYHTGERLVIIQQQNKSKKINPVLLRAKCKCKQCMNQVTGQQIVKQKDIDPQVYPVKIEEKGNYAVGIVWSDGHKNSIYSYKRLFSQEIPSQ